MDYIIFANISTINMQKFISFFFIRILGRYTQRNRPLEEGPCSDLHFRLGYREGKMGEVSAQ